MGWVMMSERDLNRIEVLAQLDDGQRWFGLSEQFRAVS